LLKVVFKYFNQLGYTKIFSQVFEDNKTSYFYEYYEEELFKTD